MAFKETWYQQYNFIGVGYALHSNLTFSRTVGVLEEALKFLFAPIIGSIMYFTVRKQYWSYGDTVVTSSRRKSERDGAITDALLVTNKTLKCNYTMGIFISVNLKD